MSKDLRRVQKLEDLRRIESAYEDKLSVMFRRQGKLMVQALDSMRSSFEEAPSQSRWGPAWERTASDTQGGFAVVTDKVHTDALAKGATRFSEDLALGVSFDLANPRAVAWLAEHSGEKLAADVNATTRGYIRTLMTHAVDEGWSYDRTARTLIERFSQFAVGQPQAHIASRAHLIAVTESAMAYEAGNALMASELAQELPMEKSWLTVGDDRVDEEQCGPNEDEGWIPLEDDFQDGSPEPPAHPACVPAGTAVLGPPIVATMRRWYEGDGVVIGTAKGNELTVTPNHEVLTVRGWLRADRLVEGDQLISRSRPHGEATSIDPDDGELPAFIEKVVAALSKASGVPAIEMPSSSEHFNRYGPAPEVHVVGTDGLLRGDGDSTGAQQPAEVGLPRSEPASRLDTEGLLDTLFGPGVTAPVSIVGGRGVVTALLRRSSSLFNPVSLGVSTSLDARLAQDAADDVTGHAVLLAQSILGYAGQVALDDVVSLGRVPLACHVYNLQTLGGWYSANGIITHNCRCTTLYQVVPGEEVVA